MAARSLMIVAAAVTPALSMSSIEERFERLEARVRALEEQNAQLQAGRPLDAPTAAAKVAAGVSARGEVGGGMGRRLSEPTCCRWTPSDECGSDTTEGCSMLHEYLETKTTTHEFAAVETCLGGTDHSNFKASFHGMDGNVSLSYGNSQVTSFKTPLKVTHAQSCSSTPPTLSLQLNTVADGTFTVASMNAVAAGQVGFGTAAAFPPQMSASIIKADDLMGLSLRLAAMTISHQVVTHDPVGKCLDINPGANGITHMWECHGHLNQKWSWMGPYLASHWDPDCIHNGGLDHSSHPRCTMQPHRLLDGGAMLCLTWGDGTATATTPGTTCPNDAGNTLSDTSTCTKIRTFVRPCALDGSDLFQQWKVKDFTNGHGLMPMAHTGNLCLDLDLGDGSRLDTWTCTDDGTADNQKFAFTSNERPR